MTIRADLHGHTYFSDGRASPAEYVDFRRQMQMQVIAIADHDIFAGVRAGALACRPTGMIFIPAAEITAFLNFGAAEAEQFHVLAYFPPEILNAYGVFEQTYLYRRGEQVQAAWKSFVMTWFDDVTAEDRAALDPDGALAKAAPGQFPALQSMINLIAARRHSLFEPFRDHHFRFWNDDKQLFGWSPEEMIDAIRADGAVDIVAHPVRYRDKPRTEAVLQYASGLEVYTSRQKADVAAHYRDYAVKNRKLWTASADDHQNARYIAPASGVPINTIERLLRKPLPIEMVLQAP